MFAFFSLLFRIPLRCSDHCFPSASCCLLPSTSLNQSCSMGDGARVMSQTVPSLKLEAFEVRRPTVESRFFCVMLGKLWNSLKWFPQRENRGDGTTTTPPRMGQSLEKMTYLSLLSKFPKGETIVSCQDHVSWIFALLLRHKIISQVLGIGPLPPDSFTEMLLRRTFHLD